MTDKLEGAFKSMSFRHSSIMTGVGVSASDICVSIVKLQAALRWLKRAEGDAQIGAISSVEVEVDDIGDSLAHLVASIEVGRNDLEVELNRIAGVFESEIAALRQANVDPISDASVRQQVFALTGGTCSYCGSQLKPDREAQHSEERFCVEHVVPRSQGGPNNLSNYVPSCQSCNSTKGDRHVLYFIRNNLPGRLARAELKVVNGGDA